MLEAGGSKEIKFRHGKGYNAIDAGRTLAKIAHAYACYKLGIDGFRPTLPNLILRGDPADASYYVGTDLGFQEAWPTVRHPLFLRWEKRIDGLEVLMVYIRLFANFDYTPLYIAVTGLRPTIISPN